MIDKNEYDIDLANTISKHEKYFETRKPSLHDQSIKASIKFKSDDSEFVNLLKHGFSHHDITDFRYINFHNVNLNSADQISRYFHHHEDYYIRPEVIQGQVEGNPTLTYDELLHKLTSSMVDGEQNQLFFLAGSVGIGKTTFICNFLSRNANQLQSKKIVPIKINLDVSTDHTTPSAIDLLVHAKRNIISALAANGIITDSEREKLTRDSRVTKKLDLDTADANLQHTLSLIKSRHGFTPLIFIDNIDYLYHQGDRGIFAIGGNNHPERKEINNAHNAILEVVNLFWRNKEFATSRMGMPVVISCRKDTISFLLSKHHEVPLTGMDDRIFSLAAPDIKTAKNVINRRFDLIEKLSENVKEPAKRSEFKRQAKSLKESYEQRKGPGKALLDDLWQVSRKGLRDMINQIAEYSWLEYLDGQKSVLNSRFTQQYYPSMLAYMLAGQRRYTQFSGNVPNIYLINAPAPSNEIGVPKKFKEPHVYTLWLKRLILEYLSVRKDFNTTEDDIIKMFCGKNRRGYSEDLVRYLLSSLYEVPTAELIEGDIAADGPAGAVGYVQQVNITERGQFILDECANSFKYIQLAVDDWKVLLPKDLISLFKYVEPDYSYLVFPEGEYGQALTHILERKGAQAFRFAILIEETFEMEMSAFPNVFTRLADQGISTNVQGMITSKIRDEITSINNAIHAGISLEYLSDESERRIRALIASKLREVYLPVQELRDKYYG